MIKQYKKYFMVIFTVLIILTPMTVFAGAKTEPLMQQDWPHKTMFGSYDRPSLQRGFQVYREVCSGCHSLRLLSYRNLVDIGFSKDEVKAIAAEQTVMDGPNDEGEMFERNARPSDRFVPPFPNVEAARFSNNGAYPADMSLLVKARKGGEDYIFSLLMGYEPAPVGTELGEGMYWNKYFKGNQIGMAPPLYGGMVTYSNGQEASLEQAARDVTQFLAWASEPKMEERKRAGVKVLLFLLAFMVVTYIAKRRMWADVH